MTTRLSIIALAGMARTLVAVGTSREKFMFLTTAAAAPRRTADWSSADAAALGLAGSDLAGSALAAGADLAGASFLAGFSAAGLAAAGFSAAGFAGAEPFEDGAAVFAGAFGGAEVLVA